MTDEKKEITENQIAHLSIIPKDKYLKAVVDMVSDIALASGISAKDTKHLDKVLIDVFQNIVRYGFEGHTDKPIDVIISTRLHSLVIALEDKGVPFDYKSMEHGEDKRFTSYLSRGYADRVNFKCLGTRGNRTEIIKTLPSTDIREQMDIREHEEHLEKAPAAKDTPFTIEIFDHENLTDLVRLVYKCYGYTYPNEFMYYPEQIDALLHGRLMVSCGAYDEERELIGHLALIFSKPGAKVGESGEAVVDPRFRGHGIFQKMKNFLKDKSSKKGVVGFYSEAVTVHPYSQKGNLDIGASEIGYLLGYSPGTVSFQSISEGEKPRRQSVALMYLPVLPSNPATTYLPEVYREIISEIHSNIEIERNIETEDQTFKFEPGSECVISVKVRADHNQGIISVESLGESTFTEIKYHLRKLCLERIDCVYVDLPLNQKGAGHIAQALRGLGFFFGYIVPEYKDSDVLRMQYLNNVEIFREDIKTASEFGDKLLSFILADMDKEQPRLGTD